MAIGINILNIRRDFQLLSRTKIECRGNGSPLQIDTRNIGLAVEVGQRQTHIVFFVARRKSQIIDKSAARLIKIFQIVRISHKRRRRNG